MDIMGERHATSKLTEGLFVYICLFGVLKLFVEKVSKSDLYCSSLSDAVPEFLWQSLSEAGGWVKPFSIKERFR
jgi:hypothetical protein